MEGIGQILPRVPVIPEKVELTFRVDLTPQLEVAKSAYGRGLADGILGTGVAFAVLLAFLFRRQSA